MPAYYLEIYVLCLGIVLLLAEAFVPGVGARKVGVTAVLGLLVGAAMCFFVEAPESTDAVFWTYYAADPLALFYKGFALITTAIVLIIGLNYEPVLRTYFSRDGRAAVSEYYILPIFVCLGLMWMASAIDLTSIFIALEVVTMGFYILVAFMRRNVGSLEAGVKYLILGALSTGFLVYGMAWLFGVTGETNLDAIRDSLLALESGDAFPEKAVLLSFALIMVGLGFKVAAVPFQMWVPDVYQGAPTPTAAFLSVGSKAGGFVVLTRILAPYLHVPGVQDKVVTALGVIAGATIILGSLAAIPQSNIKRLLGYSSIANAGFLLLALACPFAGIGVPTGVTVGFYLAAYLPMTLLCFLVITIVRRETGGEDLKALHGLHQRSPLLAFALLIGVVSLAGIPLTAGFIGKLYVFKLAVAQGAWVLLGIALVGAAAGFYYYFRIIGAMYWEEAEGGDDAPEIRIGAMTRLCIVALIAAILFLGISPGSLLERLPAGSGNTAAAVSEHADPAHP